MRSSIYIKKTWPHLLLIGALTVPAIDVHAGLWNPFAKKAPDTPITQQDTSSNIENIFIQKVLADINSKTKTYSSYSSASRKVSGADAEKHSLVLTPTHTEIIPEYSEEGLKFKLIYDEIALKNPKYIVKDLALINVLCTSHGVDTTFTSDFYGALDYKTKKSIESPHSVAELIANANAGSPTAKARWVELQAQILKNLSLSPPMTKNLQLPENTIAEISQELESELFDLEAKALQFSRKQKKMLTQWKTESGKLDQLEALPEKLNDLILNNDRQGVRKMLETYLPWTVMEPVEINAWKIWLEAIEHPNREKTTVAFRGVKYDNDKIQRRKTKDGHEIFGFMSTILTKNQGSYTRRLRSLTTNREKNGDHGFNNEASNILSVKMADQMEAHAVSPEGSNFLSFTFDPEVARSFMGLNRKSLPFGGLLAVKIDSRRMIPNIASRYNHEVEILAPLIVFPDEVLVYKEGSFTEEYTFRQYVSEVSSQSGIDFSPWLKSDGSSGVQDKEMINHYRIQGYDFMKSIIGMDKNKRTCSRVFN
jgi:hypothetical protein